MESEIRISTIMMRESAEPTFQLPSVRNFASIRSPNIIVLPPPKTRGMKNVVTEGMKTIVMPLTMPGMDSECRVVRVSGDSMAPVINNGDYIAVREVGDTSIIYWGQIYVVLLDDYRMVKYLRRHPDDSKVVLRSANPAYDDIDVPKSAIRGLFFVSKIVKVVDAG